LLSSPWPQEAAKGDIWCGTAVDGENCMPTLIFSLCAWTGKGHVFRDQKERIKKRKGHIFPVQKEGIKRKKRMEIEIN
jgi:hypothetical protein